MNIVELNVCPMTEECGMNVMSLFHYVATPCYQYQHSYYLCANLW